MDDQTVFIICKDLWNKFLNSDDEEYSKAQLFFEYLSYRKNHKRAFMIPRAYNQIADKIKALQDTDEPLKYFENYTERADFIGIGTSANEPAEMLALAKFLQYIGRDVKIVTDTFANNTTFSGFVVFDIAKLNSYLKAKEDFMDYINRKFCQSSA